MTVYILWNEGKLGEIWGIYSTEKKAEKAKAKYQLEEPDKNFRITYGKIE